MILNKYLDFIKGLSQYRDGLLLVVSSLYVLGYVTWSIFSSFHNLGPLPAIDSQYFVAGVPVLIIISVARIVMKGLNKFYKEIWPAWLEQKRKITRIIFNILVV